MKKLFLFTLPICFVLFILACSKSDNLEELLKESSVNGKSSPNSTFPIDGREESNYKIGLDDLEKNIERTLDKTKKLSDEEIEVIKKCGFGGGIVRIFNSVNKSNGRKFVEYEIDGDAFIERDELFKIANKRNKNGRQFMTNQLVSTPRVIRVTGINFEDYNPAYSPIFRDALINAVNRYNALNLGFTLEADFKPVRNIQESGNYNIAKAYGIAMTIGNNPGSSGGNSGFPYSSGAPYDAILVQSGTANFGVELLTWVMIHEIGHCVGLRHTDYFNRSLSCGSGGNEGSTWYGAVHITGTPNQTNIDMNSIMLSCFNGNEQGFFSVDDIFSLQSIY